MGIVYFDGVMMPEEEVRIPFSDRGFLCGDGAYATIQVNEGVPLFLMAHIEQLRAQCARFKLLMPPLDPEAVWELITLNQAVEGIWRLKVVVTGGESELMRLPERRGRMLIFLKPFELPPLKSLHLGVFSAPYTSCHASFKSLAHLNRYYVMEEAHRLGLDDAVTVTEGGILLETAFGNLFWIKEKTVYTCDPSLPLYFGITLKNALTMASKLNFKIEYVKWGLSEIPPHTTAFRTNTMQSIRSIAQIGERDFQKIRPCTLSLLKDMNG